MTFATQKRSLAGGLALLLGLAPVLHAQAEPLAPGREVRLFMRGVIAPFEGTLTSMDDDDLTVRLLDGSDFTLASAQLQRSEIRTRRPNLVRGALFGGAAGVGAGVWLVIAARNDCGTSQSGFCGDGANGVEKWRLVVPPLIGAAAAGLVGHFIRTPRWVPGFVPESPARDGIGFALGWSVPLTNRR